MSGKLFIISASSGAGKTTLVLEVLKRMNKQYNIERVVTYTSRSPRETEEAGIDYHFVSSQEFKKKIKKNFFLEWSIEYGNYYGTPYHIVDKISGGYSYILIIDIFGTKKIMDIANDSTSILINSVIPVWIHTKDIVDLEKRLISRSMNTKDQIKARLKLAKQEIIDVEKVGLYSNKILNDDFFKASEALEKLICFHLKK